MEQQLAIFCAEVVPDVAPYLVGSSYFPEPQTVPAARQEAKFKVQQLPVVHEAALDPHVVVAALLLSV